MTRGIIIAHPTTTMVRPSLVGAAMLMRVETNFHLFGYPGFAMVFFLVAAAGAIWLAFTILSSDHPARRR